MNLRPPTPGWSVVKLLWINARKRAAARTRRQQELMRQRKGGGSDVLGGLAMLAMAIFAAILHGALGWTLVGTLDTSMRVEAEERGKVVVSKFDDFLLKEIEEARSDLAGTRGLPPESPAVGKTPVEAQEDLMEAEDRFFKSASRDRKWEMGGSDESNERFVRAHYQKFGPEGFLPEDELGNPSLASPHTIPTGYWPFVSFVLLWWLMLMVFQGEGLEMDIQRRRHPMWEWLLSHPANPVAAFAADMLSPMMANPVYFTAPVFWMVVLGTSHGLPGVFIAAPLAGILLAIAASCINKAMEIHVMIRLSPRNRGALLGLMSWLGYAAMMLPLFTLNATALKAFLARQAAALTAWLPSWPARCLTSGWSGSPEFWQPLVSCLVIAGILLAAAAAIAWQGLRHGLQAADGGPSPRRAPIPSAIRPTFRAGSALFRKELMWFWRDRGAVVQAILIPLTIASFQVINLRGLLDHAMGSWNGLCGAAVICGTYFLLVLGPRSLASEGAALWIAMTWPTGMEELLKAKAKLWWLLSILIVGLILLVTVWMFPQDWWRIALVALGWIFFGRGLAEKTVTLVRAPSSSGEVEPAPRGRQWAAMVGTLTFGTGVISQTWDLAMSGVVFSSLAAAAMWQNFRARLPYLYDPWSEKLPPAPSVMHAMIGITVMVEAIALVSAFTIGFGGKEHFWQARAMCYGIVGFLAWIIMNQFLAGRGVKASDVWFWNRARHPLVSIVSHSGALLGGALLGGLAMLYLIGLRSLPWTRDWIMEIERLSSGGPGYKLWLSILAIGFAPLAEEYFFRGLLFRALDREWTAGRAMIGSAAYFAMFHPPASWPPVFAVGLVNAWLFRKCGSLVPCVLLHMTYNAVVVGLG